jgi:hypothetical protein
MVVSQSGADAAEESCYELGVRAGRCGTTAFLGSKCDPADNISMPARCKGDPGWDKGFREGAQQANRAAGSPLK